MKTVSVYLFWAVFAALVLTILKATGYLAITWFWALSPIWIYLSLVAVSLIVAIVFSFVIWGAAFTSLRKHFNR